jgi:cytochrome c-type biogenesis protein CcmH/NrfG
MKKESILIAAVALLAGLLGGFLIFTMSSERMTRQDGQQIPAASAPLPEYGRRIAEAEGIVAREPENLKAWISLGNDYFDTDQPQKAIQAYARALEIQPANPDVLTDQGIMYRKVGWYDRALANFRKARAIDPKQMQSLYNMGIVYAVDLKQPERAIPIWEAYLKQDQSSDSARRVRELLESIRQQKEQPGRK